MRCESMEEINTKQIYLVTLILLICVIIITTVIVWKSSKNAGPSLPIEPTLDLTVVKNNGNYLFTVVECFDPEKNLKFDDVMIIVYNESKVITSYMVEDISNDENRNVTFYDNDDNGRLSIGDEFIIDGDIVTPGTKFSGVYTTYGSLVFEKYLL
jgi:hypothetical protein